MPVVHTYSSAEMLRLVPGLTYRQVDYWVTTKLLAPSADPGEGRGKARKFIFGDLVTARVLVQMKDQGFSLQQLRKVSAAIAKNRNVFKNPLAGQKLIILPDSRGQDLAVAVIGSDRFKPAEADADVVESLLRNPGQTMLGEIVLPLHDAIEPLKTAAADLVAERKQRAAMARKKKLAADAARNRANRQRRESVG